MNISDEVLIRYLDKELDEESVIRLEQAITHDEALHSELRALEASRLPYSAAFKQKHPGMPQALREKVNTWMNISTQAVITEQPGAKRGINTAFRGATQNKAAAQSDAKNKASIFGIKGLVAAAFSGAMAAGVLFTLYSPATPEPVTKFQVWIDRVADYQSLYVRETVAHIVDGRAKADALLASMANQHGLPTTIPDLSPLGYELVRAQQLGFEGEPLIQLVYLSDKDVPLALCFMPAETKDASDVMIGQRSNLATGAWLQAGHQYVIVADESPERMQRLVKQAQLTI